MANPTVFLLRRASLVLTSFAMIAGPSGCLITDGSNYYLARGDSSNYGFSGEVFANQPSFGFYRLSDGTQYTQTSDTFNLATYSDASCTAEISGSSLSQSKASTRGLAQFSGVTYTWPTASQEGALYFKATTNRFGLSLCSGPYYVIRHFGSGVIGPTTGFAGGTAALLNDKPVAVGADSAGRYILVGFSYQNLGSGRPSATAWRYNPDATLDTTFGSSGGKTFPAIPASGSGVAGGSTSTLAEQVTSGVMDSSGRMIGVGMSRNAANNFGEAAIWRMNPTTATWDLTASFGPTGAAGQTGASENDQIFGITIDSSGNYILAGHSANAGSGVELALWRYIPGTGWDTSFGPSSNGSAHFGSTGTAGATGASEIDRAMAVAIDSRGRYVIAGTTKNASGAYELGLWRWDTAANNWDSTFGTSGGYHSGTTGAAGATGASVIDLAAGIRIDSQGRYVMAGRSADASGGTRLAIWRYLSTGSPDTSFGTNGVVIFSTPQSTAAAGATGSSWFDMATGFDIDSSGRYVIAGYSKVSASLARATVWRYLSTGELDTSFVGTGNPSTGGATYGYSMEPATNSIGTTNSRANGLYIDRVGRLVVPGYVYNGTGWQLSLWRFLPTGTQD